LRGRLEIVECILTTCLRPKGRLAIMYKGNLNWEQAKRYTEMLLQKQLLKEVTRRDGRKGTDGKTIINYETTEKGKALIQPLRKGIYLLGKK